MHVRHSPGTMLCLLLSVSMLLTSVSAATEGAEHQYQQFSKPIVRILVVGLTGHGKSSLINKMFGRDVAPVGHGAKAHQHSDYIMEYVLPLDGTTLRIYDTQGLGDAEISGEQIFHSIKSELEEVDLLIICHRLYDRAEGATKRMLEQIISQCTKDLLKRSILCYTMADEYKVRTFSIEEQKASLTDQMKIFLMEAAMTEDEFKAIPICISSDRESDLPGAPKWLDTFWQCCSRRIHPDAAGFLTWFARNKEKLIVGGVIVGVLATGGVVVTTVGISAILTVVEKAIVPIVVIVYAATTIIPAVKEANSTAILPIAQAIAMEVQPIAKEAMILLVTKTIIGSEFNK